MATPTYAERTIWAAELKRLRERRNWTQEELARKAEVSVGAVRQIERGVAGGRWMHHHLITTLKTLTKGTAS